MRFFGRDESERLVCLCQRCGTRYAVGVNAVAVTMDQSSAGNVPDRIGLIYGAHSWPQGAQPPAPSPDNPIPPAILHARQQPAYRHWTCAGCGTTQPYPWCGGVSPDAHVPTAAPQAAPEPAPPPPRPAPSEPLASAYSPTEARIAVAVTETLPVPTPEEARTLLVANGITTSEGILRALFENDDALAAAAATTLGELGDQSSVGRLIDLLSRTTVRRRISTAADAACIALGKLGGNRAVKELVELTQIAQRAGPAMEGLQFALTRHPGMLESPTLSKVVGIPGCRWQRVQNGQVENVMLDRTAVRDLARLELQRRSAGRRGEV